MRVFVRHDQRGWNGVAGMLLEGRRLHPGDQLARRSRDFGSELGSEKDRRLRDPKIGRPDFGLIDRAEERVVFLRGEVGVEGSALRRFHRP